MSYWLTRVKLGSALSYPVCSRVFGLDSILLQSSLKLDLQTMPSGTLHPAVTDEYLYAKLTKGRVAGPLSMPPLPKIHVSHFRVTPKKHQPGKWCLILDLFGPSGYSISDGIPRESFSVQYRTVGSIINSTMSLSWGVSWENLRSKAPTAMCQSIHMIAISWA